MGVDLQLAQDCLESLKLETLFVSALGWTRPQQPITITTRAFKQVYRCRCLAQRGVVTVWEIKLKRQLQLTPKIRARLYQTLRKRSPEPLLIFCDRTRSLWHWQSRLGEQTIPQSVVYIPQQPIQVWQARLSKLGHYQPAQGPLSLLPDWPVASTLAPLTASVEQHLQQLSDQITGISNAADRQAYAALLLTRLMLVYLLQRRGLLNAGDTWYLHTQLGQCQQQGADQFFQQCLKPLFKQGFSLPELERPRSIRALGSSLPYLGNVFYDHPLERQYPAIEIPDAPFEAILVWFGEPLWEDMLNPWRSAALGYACEQALSPQTGSGYASHPLVLAQLCDRTLSAFILRRLGIRPSQEAPALEDILFQADMPLCRQLIQEILPQLQILDPACGAGALLVALQQRLVELYSVLIGHLHQTPDSQLAIWLSGLQAEHPSLLQAIHRRILNNCLYGVDRAATAVDLARLHLLMSLVATAHTPQEVEPLPSLDFNILTGNSLVGFMRVDEAGFDRIKSGGDGEALQGNLLQPLAADSYRTILAEKNISLEYYKSQTHLLKELQDVPQYAQLEFLRDKINRLDQKAQAKLNNLLLTEFSQKLGIQYKEFQLRDRPQPRLLTVTDLELLDPFHWGYHFNTIIEQFGGFSLIASAPPWGSFRPDTPEFFQRFRDLVKARPLSAPPSKQSLLKADPEMAAAWLFYQSQYSFITDYFYRAEQYIHQSPTVNGKRLRTQLRRDWLFVEQCFNLLRSQGVCALLLPQDLVSDPKAAALRGLLEHKTRLQVSEPLPDSSLPPFCLVSFRKRGTDD